MINDGQEQGIIEGLKERIKEGIKQEGERK